MHKFTKAFLVACALVIGVPALAQTTNTPGIDLTANNTLTVSAVGHLRLRYSTASGALEQSIAGAAYSPVNNVSITAGSGIAVSPSPITGAGTVSLAPAGAGAGTYCTGSQFVSTTTLNTFGQVTAVSCAVPPTISGLTTNQFPVATSSTSIGDSTVRFVSGNASGSTSSVYFSGGAHGNASGIEVQTPDNLGNFGANIALNSQNAGGELWWIWSQNNNTLTPGWLLFSRGINDAEMSLTNGGHLLVNSSQLDSAAGAKIQTDGAIQMQTGSPGLIFPDGTTQVTAASGTISGLTTGVIPVATSSTVIANSTLATSSNALDLTTANTFTLGGTNATAFAFGGASNLTGGTTFNNAGSGVFTFSWGGVAKFSFSNTPTIAPSTDNTGTLGLSSLRWTSADIVSIFSPTYDVRTGVSMTFGAGTASSVGIGRSGITTTVTGGLTQQTGAFNLNGNAASTLITSTGAITITSGSTAIWSIGPSAVDTIGGILRVTAGAGGAYSATAAGAGATLFATAGGGGAGDATHTAAGGGAGQISGGNGGTNNGGGSGQGGDGNVIGGNGSAGNGSSAGGNGGSSRPSGGNGGAGTATAAAGNGGGVVSLGGNAGTNNGGGGGNGGNNTVRGGVASGAGTNGVVAIGDANTSAITVGAAAINTTFNGPILMVQGFAPHYRSAASTVTLAVTDYFVGVSGTGARTVNLPAASTCRQAGQQFMVQDIGGTGGVITINRAGADTINGTTAVSLATLAYARTILTCDGVSAWYADSTTI